MWKGIPMTCRQAALTLVVASGIAATLGAQTPAPSFEVASIRPARKPEPPFTGDNRGPRLQGRFYRGVATAMAYVRLAYRLETYQRVDGSQPVLNSHFAVNAKIADDVVVPQDVLYPMLRSLLAERFKLRVRFVDEMRPVAVLRRVKPDSVGPSLRTVAQTCRAAAAQLAAEKADAGTRPPCGVSVTNGHLSARVDRMADFARALSTFSDQPVIDDTGLTGPFEMEMAFNVETLVTKYKLSPDSPSAQLPAFDKELREKLGLKLETERRPVPALVVEHIEEPTEN
jgi:uncharacterized protein (TIGR03435 family)